MAYNYNPTPQYYPPVQQTGSPYYKILDYKERVETPQLQNTQSNYVTKDDLDSFKNEMKDLIKQFSRPVNNYKKNREES